MNINKIKETLTKIIEPYKLNIYSVKTKQEFGEKILEILLEGPNINTDILGEIHMELINQLDDNDIHPDYFLEISSVGAEYPLETLERVIDHIGAYVFIDAHRFNGFGTLLDVDGDTLLLEFNDKGQFRKIKIEYDTIRKIRTSVKI